MHDLECRLTTARIMVRTLEETVAEQSARIRELKEECDDIMRRWDSDKRIFCGALQLLKEAGLTPGSEELIAAAERFDSA